jgi:hypothetical protein
MVLHTVLHYRIADVNFYILSSGETYLKLDFNEDVNNAFKRSESLLSTSIPRKFCTNVRLNRLK